MPSVSIIMPQLGESIAEATINNYLVQPGDEVVAGQDVIEVETNKATMTVTAPCAGKLESFSAQLNESYPVGAVLGKIMATDEEAAKLGVKAAPPQKSAAAAAPVARAADKQLEPVEPTVRGLPVPAGAGGAGYLSPRLKARMHELEISVADLAGVAGSGAAGRVTVEDFENFMASLEKHKMTKASSMRIAVADVMRRSWSRPLATVGMPVKLDTLLAHRKSCEPKPGIALYALRAMGIALGENSAVAGRLVGNSIVHPLAIDIGVAVEAEDGVLVPVLRGVDKKSLKELALRYNELIELARQRKLPNDALGNSVSTVTNYGPFGLTWGTPIPPPEQTIILGLGASHKAPFWDEAKNQFVPVTEADLTLTFDHRVLDGGGAGRFLQRIAALMEQPEKL
jgi:pyruvate/2-oxoglutarate dehydrogenase complex dihydrolipoamide acyltransferase (E2) component